MKFSRYIPDCFIETIISYKNLFLYLIIVPIHLCPHFRSENLCTCFHIVIIFINSAATCFPTGSPLQYPRPDKS